MGRTLSRKDRYAFQSLAKARFAFEVDFIPIETASAVETIKQLTELRENFARRDTQFWAARDFLSPVLRESKFKEHGRITPEEFVAAGDFLSYKFPSWQWQGGDKSKRRDYLPEDKQFLVTRNVPCLRRVAQMVYTDADEDAEMLIDSEGKDVAKGGSEDDADDWVVSHSNQSRLAASVSIPSIGDISDEGHPIASTSSDPLSAKTAALSVQERGEIPDIDEIPDMEESGVTEVEDPAALVPTPAPRSASGNNVISVRTYDCYITYDKYYQTPRMYLAAYDEHKTPLDPKLIFQDISADYAQKTVTIEPFPHLQGISMASVHPCKHANVMKKIIERMNTSVAELQRQEVQKKRAKSGWGVGSAVRKVTGGSVKKDSGDSAEPEQAEGLRVDQYLIVFLKFMSSITPTIEVDATASLHF